MFIRPCYRRKNGKRHAYWALVESYRTERGPRQRVVGYIGGEEDDRYHKVRKCGARKHGVVQGVLFGEEESAEWVEVDASRVRVENTRTFGAAWLGLEVIRKIGLDEFLRQRLEVGKEEIPWHLMILVLLLSRLCEPSSELRIAEHLYKSTAMPELLGVPAEKVDDHRLYRTLDVLLPFKEMLEGYLKGRLGELFSLEYDLLLYDVTSTYFEGDVKRNTKAQRGYSRDRRGDCKQLCIALVVTKCGIPIGYEVFAGNRHDAKTVQEIVSKMEARYGQASRIWVMDRGMVSPANLEFLQQKGRRYILGTPKASLRQFEAELLKDDWREVHAGLEVKIVPEPNGGQEVYILCRSADRREKERAIHERFEKRLEDKLQALVASCEKRRRGEKKVLEQIGRLKEKNSRDAKLFKVEVTTTDDGRARVRWEKCEDQRVWANLSEGCYMLRSNIRDWSPEELWKAYIHLTDAEEAFRIHKQDMEIRPIWHHKEDRADAHILVCFLTFVVWKTLARLCHQAGLGDEPRRIFAEMNKIQLVDVILPTKQGVDLRKRCVTRPTPHQEILLSRLGLNLPFHMNQIAL